MNELIAGSCAKGPILGRVKAPYGHQDPIERKTLATLPKMTSADLDLLPDDGKLYELIEGELYVSRQPSWDHQYTCGRLFRFLDEWNEQSGLGVVNAAPRLIFGEDDDVAPDLVWISLAKLEIALGETESATRLRSLS